MSAPTKNDLLAAEIRVRQAELWLRENEHAIWVATTNRDNTISVLETRQRELEDLRTAAAAASPEAP